MITWLVQSNLIDYRQVSQICDAVRAAGANLVEAVVIPFQDDIDNPSVLENLDGIVIPYGSTKLTKITMNRGWKGSFFDPALFRVDAWNKVQPDRLLNNDQTLMTVAEAKTILDKYEPDELLFVRPRDDLKAFNGTVTAAREIQNWMQSTESGNFSFTDDTVICVSSPKKILQETRWFIVGGKIIDGSQYMLHRQRIAQLVTDTKLYNAAQELADIWLPHETCVMDLALTEDGLKVIEYNCLNSSGFYQHDIDKIVRAVTEYAKTIEEKENG